MSETKNEKLQITLTGRNPVRINKDEWPMIARASGDNWDSDDHSRHEQARLQGELDQYWIRVRQHADGRTIVYAEFKAGWGDSESASGGELLKEILDMDTIADSIKRVGQSCNIPDSVIRECIGDLPAEEL